jgi:uncharacterized protein with HEPN domain
MMSFWSAQYAIHIGIIGEAASHLSEEFRAAHSDIEWSDIIGMRNFLFHIYFRVERDILWRTVIRSIPMLVVWLERILSESESDDDQGR